MAQIDFLYNLLLRWLISSIILFTFFSIQLANTSELNFAPRKAKLIDKSILAYPLDTHINKKIAPTTSHPRPIKFNHWNQAIYKVKIAKKEAFWPIKIYSGSAYLNIRNRGNIEGNLINMSEEKIKIELPKTIAGMVWKRILKWGSAVVGTEILYLIWRHKLEWGTDALDLYTTHIELQIGVLLLILTVFLIFCFRWLIKEMEENMNYVTAYSKENADKIALLIERNNRDFQRQIMIVHVLFTTPPHRSSGDEIQDKIDRLKQVFPILRRMTDFNVLDDTDLRVAIGLYIWGERGFME